MPELPLTPSGRPTAETILSVSALNRSVRDLLEHRFPLAWVAGEISNLTLARSGHWYFSLKDDNAQVRCVMFRHRAQFLNWQPREGMHVEARALVTLYEARGDFQLNIEFMRQAGQGALYEAFLRLRDKLAAEGLFDPALKRSLPPFPRAIGIVTSPHAAALRDVLTTLARRNPSIPVILYPTSVQGEAAPAEIVAALRAASRRAEVDALILCRGGGSIEDLWAFNDEAVARAIRECVVPVVCGVGHETDVTIADYAADQRAPTPTAAAELLSPDRASLLERIAQLRGTLQRCMTRLLESRMQHVDHLSRRLVHPGERLRAQQRLLTQLCSRLSHAATRDLERRHWQVHSLLERGRRALPNVDARRARLSELMHRLAAASTRGLTAHDARLTHLSRALAHLDPRAVLERGYSLVTDETGRVVRDAHALERGDGLHIAFARGSALARVEDTRED
ncbi:MAG TPA: exodeoxyribonuclease VII large subunit [Burkholderiales bacterium]|nr:exodeoxyribonuclease VII large subunit [Burkholderiales bacterium]